MRILYTRRTALGVIAACGIVVAAVWLLRTIQQFDTSTDLTLAEMVAGIQEDEPDAAVRARRVALRDWPRCRPVVQDMLSDSHWRVRAVACEILADRDDPQMIAALVSRCSDVDWRVRAAAVEAMSQLHSMPASQSLRDMPLEQRDRLLLSWLDSLPADGTERLADRLCDLYADARHVEFSHAVVQRCLDCHAGPPPRPPTAGANCRSCHQTIHRQWANSAHANSLTHLTLPTIVEGRVRPMEFGDLRGIDCTACHHVTGWPSSAAQPDRADTACPYTFGAKPIDQVCGRCHEPTMRQWRRWRSGSQPRRASWPPGQVDQTGPVDERDCADCHMTSETQPSDPRALSTHHWGARRNRSLLASGIALQVTPQSDDPDGTVLRLTMTNLSGHDYPTGTRRRAVRLFAGPYNTELTPLVTLRPRGPGSVHTEDAPALAPGEQRQFELSVPPETTDIVYMLVYHRDLADPNGFTDEILSGGYRLNPWRSGEE